MATNKISVKQLTSEQKAQRIKEIIAIWEEKSQKDRDYYAYSEWIELRYE